MEKRNHPRMSVLIPATIRCRGRLFPATALNVSCGGIYLEIEVESLTENTAVEVTFDLDNENRDISLCGTIARVENNTQPRVGVQFGSQFSQSHKVLREFLRRNFN